MVEDPDASLTTRCEVHRDAAAAERCTACGRAMCEACTSRTPAGEAVCTECITAGADRRRRVRRAIAAVAAVAAIGVIALVFARSTDDTTVADATEARRDDSARIRQLREDWGRHRCTQAIVVDLGEALLRAGDAEGAIAVVEQYKRQCEVARRVLWVELTARKRLEQWRKALAITDRLVTERPSDLNYWWWRAELRDRLGQLDAAAADYRQSFALRPTDAAAGGLQTVRRCQSAFAWTIYVLSDPEDRDWAGWKATEPFDRPACRALIGAGGASLTWDEESGLLTADASVGGAALRAIVDPHAGTSAITPAALARVGVTARDGRIATRIGDSMVGGPPALLESIDVQGARARQLTVVVAAPLPAGADLVLGINFLWRFTRHDVDYGIVLTPWELAPEAAGAPPEEPAP